MGVFKGVQGAFHLYIRPYCPLVLHSARNSKHRVHFLRLLLRLSVKNGDIFTHHGRPAFPYTDDRADIFAFAQWGNISCNKKKRRYNTGGVALFLSLSIFAVGRFFLEFLKDSDKRLLGFLHPLQLHMLFLLTVCLISLAYIYALRKEKEAKQYTKKKSNAKREKKRKKQLPSWQDGKKMI